jgi:hypothetical protein
MLQRLQETGIPNKIVILIKMTIQHTRASVIVGNLKPDPLANLTAVCQGDPLSAPLFNIVLVSVIRKLELFSDISFKLIQLNAYADDTALTAKTKKAVIEIFNNVREEASLVELHTNEDKTIYMHIQRTGLRNKIPLQINNYYFGKVNNFT